MIRRTFSDGCCTTLAGVGFWIGAFVGLYVAGLVLRTVWFPLAPYRDTLILAALGAACLINFGRRRTLHCGLTGPLFVLGAAAAALVEAGVWHFRLPVIWGVVLVGVAAAVIVEWWIVGRVHTRPDDPVFGHGSGGTRHGPLPGLRLDRRGGPTPDRAPD